MPGFKEICEICMGYMIDIPGKFGWKRCLGCSYCKEFRMITRSEVLMGRDKEFPLTPELEKNLEELLVAVNKLRGIYGFPMFVSSGYRPGHYNTDAGGAKGSTHLTCQAVDFKDADGKLKRWITPEILEQCGLYMEDPAATSTWMHCQTRPTKNRIFKV